MISYIRGQVLSIGQNSILVENQGLGYKLFAPPEVLEHAVGDTLELYVYTKVSDDGYSLFGLPDTASLDFFEMLLTVSGVGPKVAMSILSASKPDALQTAIVSGDSTLFTHIAGVGKKTAERIILELKTKITALGVAPAGGGSDVYEALVALGYSPREVRDALPKIDATVSQEQQLKQALKFLGRT